MTSRSGNDQIKFNLFLSFGIDNHVTQNLVTLNPEPFTTSNQRTPLHLHKPQENDELVLAKTEEKTALETELAANETLLSEADAAFEELTAALCKGEYTTRVWVDSINRFIDVGALEIIPDADRAHTIVVPGTAEADAPGGGPNARRVVGDADSAAFATANDGGVTNTALLSRVTCKALGEFLTQSQVEKKTPASSTVAGTQPTATPKYEPNVFVGAELAAAGCEPWADSMISALGDTVERLDKVVIRWRDTKVPGISTVLKAMTTMGEDPEATPEQRKVGGAYVELDDFSDGAVKVLRECAVLGVMPIGLILPASHAFSKQAQLVRQECDALGVEILVKDVLMGGLVGEKYVGVAEKSLKFPVLAEKRGTPEFEPLRNILSSSDGWDKHLDVLNALKASEVGSIETAAVNMFLERDMRCVVTSALTEPPGFEILPEYLPERCKPKPVEEATETCEEATEEGTKEETEEAVEEETPEPGKVLPSKLDDARAVWNKAYGAVANPAA